MPLRMWAFILVTAAGGAASALLPIEPTWHWLAFIVTIAGAIGAGFAASPSQAKRLEWHERELAALARGAQTSDTGSVGKTP